MAKNILIKITFCNFFIAESYFLWYNEYIKKNWAKPSKIKGFSPVLFRTGEPKKRYSVEYLFFYPIRYHFEDYSSELEDGDDDYIKRAKKFLIELFENQIKYIGIYKGEKLTTEKYYFVHSDNTEERIGGTWWGLERFLNPFAKKIEKTTFYKFNKDEGCFE